MTDIPTKRGILDPETDIRREKMMSTDTGTAPWRQIEVSHLRAKDRQQTTRSLEGAWNGSSLIASGEPTLVTPRSWTFSLQNGDALHLSYFSHPVYAICHGGPIIIQHPYSSSCFRPGLSVNAESSRCSPDEKQVHAAGLWWSTDMRRATRNWSLMCRFPQEVKQDGVLLSYFSFYTATSVLSWSPL